MTTDEFDADGFDADDEQQQYGDNPNLRQLRKKARDHDTVLAERDQLKRELAFTKAGIPDTPIGRLLAKSYDGEPTPEAIRAYAVEHGVLEQSDVPGDELDALDRVGALGDGGSAGAGTDRDFNAELRRAAGRA